MTSNKRIVAVQGPTGVGKTAVGVALAVRYGAPVVSADSRQLYREMSIGTAVPSAGELAAARHYFIQDRSIFEPTTAGEYEQEALKLLTERLFPQHDTVILVGGSGLYVDALLEGFDALPGGSAQLRGELSALSLDELLAELQERDPAYYARVDRHNPRRVMRAVEVCRLAGGPYSALRQKQMLEHKGLRPFGVIRIGLELPRAELYQRIDRRVDAMIEAGLVAEARELYPHRHLPALRTVGYRELFDHFGGLLTLPQAIELIKQHTRNYAKRQLTWLNRAEPKIRRFDPTARGAIDDMIAYIEGIQPPTQTHPQTHPDGLV